MFSDLLGSKMNPKITQDGGLTGKLGWAYLKSSCRQCGPDMAQDGPKMTQDRPSMAQDGPKMTQEGPKMVQDGPKINQDAPKKAPRYA